MKTIADIFYDHYQQKKLAHFYVVRTNSGISAQNNDQLLSNWGLQLFSRILGGKSLQNHADCLIFQDQDQTSLIREKNYAIDDMEQLNTFLQFKPLSLNYKFIVMPSAHLLSELVCNHLLKVLEEPPAFAVFIIINQSNIKLLSTIESRAVNLRIGPKELKLENLFDQNSGPEIDLTKLRLLSLSDFNEQIKDRETEKAILLAIGRKVLQSQQISHHLDYQKLLKTYESSVAWNDTVYNRFLMTYQLIKNL
jgi:hypothetical protein